MNLSKLSHESRNLLRKICYRKVYDKQAWEQTYGVFKGIMSEEEYSIISDATEEIEQKAALGLSELGEWTVYTHVISGSSASNISNYDIEEILIKKFGESKIMPDSESSWFFIMTSADIVDEVYVLARELTGAVQGLKWETYGGDTGIAELNIIDDPERYMIDGIHSMKKTLQLLKDLTNVNG